jgi:hypothetical protein
MKTMLVEFEGRRKDQVQIGTLFKGDHALILSITGYIPQVLLVRIESFNARLNTVDGAILRPKHRGIVVNFNRDASTSALRLTDEEVKAILDRPEVDN